MPVAADRLLALGFERVPSESNTRATIDRGLPHVSAERAAMGTRVAITAVGPSAAQLDEAVAAAFAELDRLVALLSRRDPATPLAHLNRSARLLDPPPELSAVVQRAATWHHLTGGAFDVTVLPVLQLYERHAAHGLLPDFADVREAKTLVGAQHVAVERRAITLTRSGMAVTLDAIAKGYIVDRVAAALERHGVRRYLVDAGGDIRVRGRNLRGTSWHIAVQDPDGNGRYPDIVALRGGAVATSGSYERRFDDAEIHHHIIEPARGHSPPRSRSVTVTAPTATDADALATAVFLMGPVAGRRFVDRLPGCACLVIDRRGITYRSRAWRSAPRDQMEDIA